VLLKFQFLRLWANFILEAYFGMYTVCIGGKMLENLSMTKEIRILKALKFSDGKLWTFGTGFLSYDLTALFFSVVTLCLEVSILYFKINYVAFSNLARDNSNPANVRWPIIIQPSTKTVSWKSQQTDKKCFWYKKTVRDLIENIAFSFSQMK